MFIYCNGDSFTQGDELGDSVIPGWSGPVNQATSFEESSARTLKEWPWHHNAVNKLSVDQLQQQAKLELELSWPSQLAKLLGADFKNAGKGGSSMQTILWRTMLDLNEINREIDYVFIMLTSPQRLTMFSAEFEDHYECCRSYMYGYSMGYSPDIQHLMKTQLVVETEKDMVLRYLNDIVLTNTCVHSATGKFPILLESTMNHFYKSLLEQYSNVSSIKRLIKLSRINNIPKQLKMPTYMVAGELVMPMGHLTAAVHTRFAEGVAAYLTSYKEQT